MESNIKPKPDIRNHHQPILANAVQVYPLKKLIATDKEVSIILKLKAMNKTKAIFKLK